jgi:Fur family peroxide stress response transcriptional regulator
MDMTKIRDLIMNAGLKVTPQRMLVLEAVTEMKNHPTADHIIEFIRQSNPNIAVGTIYKVLENFVDKGLIKMVKTDKDKMRYDAFLEKHHHLYCVNSDRIEDYNDEELNVLIENYFKTKTIPGFTIEDIKLQIIGTFKN